MEKQEQLINRLEETLELAKQGKMTDLVIAGKTTEDELVIGMMTDNVTGLGLAHTLVNEIEGKVNASRSASRLADLIFR